ncbi:hypothetical protein PHISCL_01323 [Aspergillus sclerotialis]|uniref:GPI anchored serine-threonine rich protein n=1 Tax=Aspergillus sclerotialis TaxID=2070753 RepID=A0A3A2ZUF8_9EURO|nr:hypothetical protein PHISCL_01323 [Aspergillus sclerotialis]
MVAGYAKFLLPLFLSSLVTANNLPLAELTPALTGRLGTPKQGTDPVSLGLIRRQATCPGGSLPCDKGAGCCDYACCGTGCCDAGELCYDKEGPAICCKAYTEAKCQDSCMPFDATCCGDGTYCLWGNKCVPGGCCPWGKTCSGPGGTSTITDTDPGRKPTVPPTVTETVPVEPTITEPSEPTQTEPTPTETVPPVTSPTTSSPVIPTSSPVEPTGGESSSAPVVPSTPSSSANVPVVTANAGSALGVEMGRLAAAAMAVGVFGRI